MKKLLFLGLTALALTGCGSDDDKTVSNKILGSWKLTAVTDDGDTEILTDCEKKSTISFVEAQKAFTVADYNDIGTPGNVCELETFSGTWQSFSENAYILNITGQSSEAFEITFSGNTMSMKFNDGSATEPYYIVTTYTRI